MLTLPAPLESQINQLASKSGQSVDMFLANLISDYLDDNDVIEADAIYQRILTGQDQTVPFEQLMKENGLDG
ncbi:MAG: hypothetical protein WAW36_13900 [Methylovulum miyakonense]|uniref:hypothetical protein n=1 Tax=Methylovulum miyakonense TaxID=645578 RepID=UPI003BB7D752